MTSVDQTAICNEQEANNELASDLNQNNQAQDENEDFLSQNSRGDKVEIEKTEVENPESDLN